MDLRAASIAGSDPSVATTMFIVSSIDTERYSTSTPSCIELAPGERGGSPGSPPGFPPRPNPSAPTFPSRSLTVEFLFQCIKAVRYVFDPARRVNVESVKDLKSVSIRVLRSDITGKALHVLSDHYDRQQDQLKEGL